MKLITNIFLACLFFLQIASCTKKQEPVVNPTLDEFLKQNETTTGLYSQMIEKAQLATFKNGAGPFTWMIPSNSALIAAGVTQDSINKMTTGRASYLVMYNIFGTTATAPTPLTSYDILGRNSFSRATLLASTNAFLGTKNGEFFVNGSKITMVDKSLSNGYVNVLNRFNTPPQLRGNVQTIVSRLSINSQPDTLFFLALRRANLLSILSTSTAITVLAPTNAAMIDAGYSLPVLSGTLSAAQITTLSNFLRYHYFPGIRYFSNDFNNGLSPFTALNNRSLVVSNNGNSLRGTNNPTPVNIITTDLLGTNGVVHVIDGVLRP